MGCAISILGVAPGSSVTSSFRGAGSWKLQRRSQRPAFPEAPVRMPCVPCNLQLFLGDYTDRLITRVAHSSYGARGSLASTYSLSPRVQH